MTPKYAKLKDDLAALKNKVLAVRAEFQKSVKAGDVEKDLKESYNALNEAFEKLEAGFAVLEDEKSSDEARDAAWSDIDRNIRFPGDYLPRPSKYNEPAVKDFNSKIGTDNFRRLYRTANKLRDLGYEVKSMSGRQTFENIGNKLDDYAVQREKYQTELYSFNEPLNFDSYSDMVRKQKLYREQLIKAQNEYDEYVKLREVERLSAEYKAVSVEVMQTVVQLRSQLREINKQIEENDNQLASVDEQIRELQEQESLYKATLDRDIGRINEIYGRINTISSTSIELSQKITEIEVQQEKINDTYRNYEQSLRELESAEVDENAPNELQVTTQLKGELAGYFNREADIAAYKQRVQNYLAKNGYADLPAAKIKSMLHDGMLYSKLDKKIVDAYEKAGVQSVMKPLQFYKDFQKFKDEFKGIYGASEKMSKEIDENIVTPADLFRLTDKAADDLDAKANDLLAIKDGDSRLNGISADFVRPGFNDIARANGELQAFLHQKLALEARQNDLLEQKNKIEAEMHKLDTQAKELQKEAEANSFDAKLKGLFQKRNKLVEAKEELMAKNEYLTGAIASAEERKLEARDRYLNASNKLDNLKKEYEKSKNLSEKTDAQKEKFDSFCRTHDELKIKNDDIRRAININSHNHIGRDFWVDTKSETTERVNSFLETAECGKKSGHNNSEEFKQMLSALQRFSEADENLSAMPALADYKRMLENIRDAAKNYLDKKATEIRPLASAQRKYRLDFARRLRDFAESAAEKFGEMDASVKNTNARIDSLGITKEGMTDSINKVLEDVNEAVALKQEFMKKQHADSKELSKGVKHEKDGPSIS